MGTNRLMTIFMFIAVFSLLTTSLSYNPQEAFAADPFADEVISVGQYGHPTTLATGNNDGFADVVLGAPDSPPSNNFIQLSLDNEITVKFDDNVAFRDCTDGPDLRIHTFDVPFEANADVFVSNDGVNFVKVATDLPDYNPANPVNSNFFFADIDLDATVIDGSIQYVKLVTTIDTFGNPPGAPGLGFDLDAVEALHTVDPQCSTPPQECVENVIDFESPEEEVCTFDSSDWISIGGTSVLLQVGNLDGYATIHGANSKSPATGTIVNSVPLGPGITVTVGGPLPESFRSNGVDDQPEPDNPEDNMCFFSDASTFPDQRENPNKLDPNRGDSNSFYYLTFADPINSLRLDLYDYADDTVYGGAFKNCNGNTDFCTIDAVATLTAFANDDFTDIVGFAEYTVDESYVDGQIANLSIPATVVSYKSAILTLSAADIGTGIDNITFCEESAPPEELELEKFYTHTNNNWDLVCAEFELDSETQEPTDVCLAYREANINTEDVFAMPLPDTDGTYELLGDEKKKKTVVNPGQYIQATTITVPTEQTIWFKEDVGICSDIGTINPDKVPGGVQVVRIDTDGNVFDIDDDLADGIGGSLTLTGTLVEVHVDDVPAGNTIRIMVKFQPSDALGIIGNECTLTADLLDVDDAIIDSVSADLIIIQK